MKFKILLTLLVALFSFSASYASFPVKRTVSTATEITTGDSTTTEVLTPIASAVGDNLVVGILLWFFLGWAAGHRWYYGKPILWNIVFILTAGGLGVWWIIDLINMITGRF
ncbi:TM2 domain-containing protein [Aestuariibaculum suncheonense]|uniref:TM2 domain-containing protein n=1 Tax=Aestuariibaculum suncheonense TaxID=1028745 RepID=A0A8J6UBS0_9FLAO|nr:TM2 domain-containing protein [Aestuariibaculum suncheonense]MBD0835712.1 TM2 domain-containing protein [Aestuariibaculum suncheonense]